MLTTEGDTILTDLFVLFFFIGHVNYIKIKANNTATKYLENNMTQHNKVPDILGSSIKFGHPICTHSHSGAQFLEASP